MIPYIKSADEAHSATSPGCTNGKLNGNNSHTSLVDPDALSPARLSELLDFSLPEKGLGKDGLLGVVSKVLKYSVNTWNPGFMDKLYASTNAVGF